MLKTINLDYLYKPITPGNIHLLDDLVAKYSYTMKFPTVEIGLRIPHILLNQCRGKIAFSSGHGGRSAPPLPATAADCD